ncbi:MAG: ferritin-like domain-containing protein [Candidatus Micrarchaeota archaeon]|nr:ferritin-like domain-containing protein [Candidatus Micrarchaeota archaeon]
MGTVARKIVKGDVNKTIELLNKALADEWLAFYQYWVGALVVEGPLRPDVQEELEEHAKEEFEHANMLAKRIIELGGEPILNPNQLEKYSNCGYDEPKDFHVLKILDQNIKGEQCAIEVYSSILENLKGDPITFNLIRKIMEDEVEHEQELEDLKKDILLIGKTKQ